jgi:hypothetical protein
MRNEVKSGKEILDDFFKEIRNIPHVDKTLAQSLTTLYEQGKLTDTNVKNELHNLRQQDADQN